MHKPQLWKEIQSVITAVDAEKCKSKVSKEKTMKGKLLYSPIDMNAAFNKLLRIEILPMKSLQSHMSSGVAYYEGEFYNVVRQGRGVPAVPLVIIGIAP